jgi:hypothetical protein
MKKVLACVVGLFVAQLGMAGESRRSGYEVFLTNGADKWEASTVAPLEKGRIQQGLGPYLVTMSVVEESGDKYTMQLRVTGQPGAPTADSEFIRKSFAGTHTEQLEFAASEGDLAIKGVIFVGPPKRASR